MYHHALAPDQLRLAPSPGSRAGRRVAAGSRGRRGMDPAEAWTRWMRPASAGCWAPAEQLAASGTSDLADAHLVIRARRADQPVVTSDPGDLRQLDPTLRLVPL